MKTLGDILTLLLVFGPAVIGMIALLRPRRQRVTPSGASRGPLMPPVGRRRIPQAVVAGALLGRSLAWLERSIVGFWRSITTSYQMERRQATRVEPSRPLLSAMSSDDDGDLIDDDPIPHNRAQTQDAGRRTHQEADINMGKNRMAGVVMLVQGGMDVETILRVAAKEPDALTAALKIASARWVAYVMRGNYQENMGIIRGLVNNLQDD